MILLCFFVATIASCYSQHVGSCGREAAIEYAKATVRPASIKNNIMAFPADERAANEFCK